MTKDGLCLDPFIIFTFYYRNLPFSAPLRLCARTVFFKVCARTIRLKAWNFCAPAGIFVTEPAGQPLCALRMEESPGSAGQGAR